uniref:Retrotransposon gag domain-containing protein n=1 Tax=Fagus sylvatica TaxID=28930 RepID=A0A2N9IP64_FAGSY
MAGETSGPNEQEVRMAALEHKFDDLLAFVHMMVKQVAEMGNQKRKDGKNTNGEVSEGRPHINMDPLPRPPTLPKPEERDPQLDSKIDGSEEKIRLMRGLELLRNTDSFTEWYSQLKKISHWKELADTFLAQYGLNSQIEPDCFDRQRMEKKSSEIFREYTQWWREMAASGMPPSRRERDDQDLRRYPEEPILRSNSGFAIAVPCGLNS